MCWRKEKAWILLSFSASVYEGYILSSDVYSVACVSGLGDHVATSGCSSLSESFRGIFFEPTTVENPRFVVGISTLSIIVPKTEVLLLPVWAVILLFPVVGCCRNHLVTLLSSPWSESYTFWVHLQHYLFWIWFCNISQHEHGILRV